jgi:hypothetical protein
VNLLSPCTLAGPGAGIFFAAERWPFFDSFYFMVVTMARARARSKVAGGRYQTSGHMSNFHRRVSPTREVVRTKEGSNSAGSKIPAQNAVLLAPFSVQ